MGYNSMSFVANLGSIFWYIVCICMFGTLIPLVRIIVMKYPIHLRRVDKVIEVVFFKTILRGVIEGYLEFLIGALLNLTSMEFGNNSQRFNTIFAIVMVIGTILFPFGATVFFIRYKGRFMEPNIEKRAGSLYENLRLEGPPVYYHVFFTLRRLILAIVIVFLNDSPVV